MRAAVVCAQLSARRPRAAPLARAWDQGERALGAAPVFRTGLRSFSSTDSAPDLSTASEEKKQHHLRAWRLHAAAKYRARADARKAELEARIANARTTVVDHPVVLPFRDPTAPDTFAVVALSGTQYKVVEDDLIVCNILEGAEVGKEYVIDDVLLVGGLGKTVIGRPVIKGATVTALVEEITRDKKILIMKRRTKNHKSRRTKGFRRDVTFLRITSIDYDLKQI